MPLLSRNQVITGVLPEKVLQFGTGILLRGLPDYFIDKANKQDIFNGSIVVVKSTKGSTIEFGKQDNLFTTLVRGMENGKNIEENIINSAISRVLSADDEWTEILMLATSSDLKVIISNTTEVGIRYEAESISQTPPSSFPAKLTAILYKRFSILGSNTAGFTIIPTELILDNGHKLKEIVLQLADFNALSEDFKNWVKTKNYFCNSLVDRIVTNATASLKANLDYQDDLAIQTEPYRLWAIEGGSKVKKTLSFASVDAGVIIEENIDYYRERKLRILNGTHTISVCLGYLKGFNTVFECMQDAEMYAFIKNVVFDEIVPSLPLEAMHKEKEECLAFANEVLDRFHNPHTAHYLLNITLQETSKMKMRNVLTLFRYYEIFGKVPTLFAKGFAAYLLFMKPIREENGVFYGKRNQDEYQIKDDWAGEFAKMWSLLTDLQNTTQVQSFVATVCKNTQIWGEDLTTVNGFAEAISAEILTHTVL